ncbi:serine hydroxymethyltransferase, partial [Candidatus Micrarchaeota archaeon]|nr:serine hydroxymethyltransferase [Candidatus Micrarchaeota archaeon]MBU2476214.1 serine hydroxymethyltransferase [Candidatus Micrarchaeota archaeon]
MVLEKADSKVFEAIQNETKRQMQGLELIASENYVSKSVLEAMGSVFTNKYSEGYPHKRYYGGNEFVDVIEDLAIERAKKLFNAEHVNVQPYSGSPANQAVFVALMNLGDKFMGMSLAMGGHLTHGHKVSFSGMQYHAIGYGVSKETELIDYDAIRKTALEEKPKMIISGASAYPRKIDFKKLKEIAEEVNAISFADIAHIAGLCCSGLHENPVPFFEVVTTTTHKTLRGPRGAMILCKQEHAEKIDKAVFPGLQGGPHDHINAAKAVAFGEALNPDFKDYSKQIIKNAQALGDTLQDYGFRLVSGGTDNHLLLIDLTKKEITGKEAELILDEAGIYCNKNMIPFDTKSPFNPSGIRLGTPALTTRGFKEEEMKMVGEWINRIIENKNDESVRKKVREEVKELCKNFVIY